MASATAPSATAAPGFRHVVTARRALAARRAGFAGGANLLARPSAPAAPDRDARVQTVADGERRAWYASTRIAFLTFATFNLARNASQICSVSRTEGVYTDD